MIAPDSSVTIAAAAPWQVTDDASSAALSAEEASLTSHVAFETAIPQSAPTAAAPVYSVLGVNPVYIVAS